MTGLDGTQPQVPLAPHAAQRRQAGGDEATIYRSRVGTGGASLDPLLRTVLRRRHGDLLRRLEALLVVADRESSFIISGNGDVIEPEDNIMAIGSGGAYAQAAARALLDNTKLDARAVAEKALNIAGDICIYTNRNLTIETLNSG